MAPGRSQKPRALDLSDIEARLGHVFVDRTLLARALTHPSAVSAADKRHATYQRLEFLGDRVLGLAVAAMLFDQDPTVDEGSMSRRLSDLVRAETCAEVAAALELGRALQVGPSETRAGVTKRGSVLSDICEAVIGAIYVDAGWEPARAFVERHWRPLVEKTPLRLRDAKSELQEWAQGRAMPTPFYRLIERTGPDHAPQFTIAVVVPGLAEATGVGRSKREAEIAAATGVLLREGIWAPEGEAAEEGLS